MERQRRHHALAMGAVLAGALVACDVGPVPGATSVTTTSAAAIAPTGTVAASLDDLAPDYAHGCATLRDVATSDVVRIDGKTLYYLDEGSGLEVVDVSNAALPRLRSRVTHVGTPLRLFVREGIAWVVYVDWDRRVPGHKGPASTVIRAIDVHDDDHPRVLGEVVRDGVAHDAQLVGGLLYVLHDVAVKASALESFGVRQGALVRLDATTIDGHGVELAASSAGVVVLASRDDGVGVTWFDLPMESLGQLTRKSAAIVPGGLPRRIEGGSRAAAADEGYEVHVITCDTPACAPQDGSHLHLVDVAPALPRVTHGARLAEHGGFPVTRFVDDRLYVATPTGVTEESSELTAVALYPRPVASAPLRLPGTVTSLVMRAPGRLLAAVRQITPGQHRILVEDIDVRLLAPRLRGTAAFGSSFVWSNASEHAETLSFDPGAQIVAIPYSGFQDDRERRYETGAQLVDLGPRGPRLGETVREPEPVVRAVFYGDRLLLVGPDGVRSVAYQGNELGSEAP